MNDKSECGGIPPRTSDTEHIPDQPDEIAPAASAASQWITWLATPRVAVPFLLAFSVVLIIVSLGTYPMYTKGEPRAAIRILDIVHNGNWILPKQGGIGLPWKPPMMYWLGAIISLLAGVVNEWTARLPSGLLAVGAILCCYGYVRKLFDQRSALVAALILATTLQFGQAATAARVDMTLTFFTEIAFFEFICIAEGLTRRRMLLYLAIAAAVLAKGPIGLALPGLVALIWIAIERRWQVLREMRLISGTLVVIVLAGGWYLAASFIGGEAFVHRQILAENLYRLIPNHAFHEPHEHPFYWIELALLAGFLPWTGAVPLALTAIPEKARLWTPRFKYLVVWAATVLVFYNLPRSKRGVYLLALYPAAAALTALMLNAVRQRTSQSSRMVRFTALAGGIVFLAIGLAAFASGVAMWLYGPGVLASIMKAVGLRATGLAAELWNATSAHPIAAIVLPAVVGASGAYLLLSRVDIDSLFTAVLAGISCSILVAHIVVVPAIARTLTLKQFTVESTKLAGDHPVVSLWPVNFDVAFYGGRNIVVFSHKQTRAVFQGDKNVALPTRARNAEYFILWRHHYRLLSEEKRQRFPVVMTSNPTSPKGKGRMVLLKRADLPSDAVSVNQKNHAPTGTP